MTVCEEEDEDTLVEEGPQIERGTVFHKDTWHSEVYPRNIVTKRLPREACFDQGDCQVEEDVVTLSGEEDEDTLVEEGPQIERGTVFLRDTCHSEISKETFVTSGTRLKHVLIWAMSKWRKTL